MKAALLKKRGLIRPAMAILSCCMATWSAMTFAQTIQPGAPYPVGMKQLEYVDAVQGNRHLALTLFSFRPAYSPRSKPRLRNIGSARGSRPRKARNAERCSRLSPALYT